MKLQDKETQDIAKTAANILEGKPEVKEVSYPHKMYDPKTGEEVEIKSEAEHDEYTKKGWVHEKPKVNEVEEPRAKGEKEFKAKHAIKKSGMKNDGSNMKESVESDEEEVVEDPLEEIIQEPGTGIETEEAEVMEAKASEANTSADDQVEPVVTDGGYEDEEELSPKQKKYQAMFKKALKKFGVKSPSELDKEKRKEFFDYIDKNYDAGENETD
tara:strand:+ start:2383 stop:3024 length:642 start_codon:yes stop_codon:yes gene_type:complete